MKIVFDNPVLVAVSAENDFFRYVNAKEFTNLFSHYIKENEDKVFPMAGAFISRLKSSIHGVSGLYVHEFYSGTTQDYLLNQLHTYDVVLAIDKESLIESMKQEDNVETS